MRLWRIGEQSCVTSRFKKICNRLCNRVTNCSDIFKKGVSGFGMPVCNNIVMERQSKAVLQWGKACTVFYGFNLQEIELCSKI
jgi:hypothetical protein